MKNKREQRLNSEFRNEIYDVLKNRIKNPDITEMFSIVEVETASDLKHAKVFVSVYSADAAKKKATFDAICDSAKAVRAEIGKRMHIRTVPELHFLPDNSAEYGDKIDEILNKITYSGNFDEEETDE